MPTKDIFVVKQPMIAMPRVSGVRFLSNPSTVHGVLIEPRKTVDWKKATWLAVDLSSADMLLGEVREQKPRFFGRLAVLERATPSIVALGTKYFTTVVTQPGLIWLPNHQVIRTINSDDAADRVVAGMVDKDAGNLLLYRGDLQPVVAPLDSIKPRLGVEPNFNDFEIIDWGHSLRFGEFEASVDSILYENDADYRRRIRQRRHADEKTFGASLRRLRRQREMRQSDFEPDVAAKTIARLENDEVEKPHGQTLQRIADALGVAPEEIETY
jgi:hypothetical protein